MGTFARIRAGWLKKSPYRAALLLSVSVLVVAVAAARAADAATGATIVVNSLDDNAVAGDGACTLREAISNANANNDTSSGDCAAGSSKDTISIAITGAIALGSAAPTITDGAGLTIGGPGAEKLTLSGGNAVQVLAIAPGAALELHGVSVMNGAANHGGGIYNEGTLQLSNAQVSENRALDPSALGAGIYNSGTVTVLDSTLADNFAGFPAGASGGAGAIFNSGTLAISHSTISGNFAGGVAGGIINSGVTTVSDSTFSANSGHTGSTGAIQNSGTLTVTRSAFADNHASIGSGGAISNFGTLAVSDSTFSSNTANLDGAGIQNGPELPGTGSAAATAVIRDSTFSGNVATVGGGVFNNGGTMAVSNSTFSRNGVRIFCCFETFRGGGIYNSGSLTVSTSTFADNFAEQGLGGAIDSPGGLLLLSGTILDNSANSQILNCAVSNLADGGYNLSSDTSCSFTTSSSLANKKPLLGPLSDNGGLTETMSLLAGSPAVNRIPPGAIGCGTTLTADQRNLPRPIGIGCDVGAYEDGSAPLQLAYLLAAATNAGPGSSLADKVKLIQGFVTANDARDACAALTTFIAEARAQIGKKLTASQAAALTAEARTIQGLLTC